MNNFWGLWQANSLNQCYKGSKCLLGIWFSWHWSHFWIWYTQMEVLPDFRGILAPKLTKSCTSACFLIHWAYLSLSLCSPCIVCTISHVSVGDLQLGSWEWLSSSALMIQGLRLFPSPQFHQCLTRNIEGNTGLRKWDGRELCLPLSFSSLILHFPPGTSLHSLPTSLCP